MLTVTDSTFIGNLMIGGDGSAGIAGSSRGGGAIATEGNQITITGCAFAGNHALGGAGGSGAAGGAGSGGAIADDFFGLGIVGHAVITDSRFGDNAAIGGIGGVGADGGTGAGGAITVGHLSLLGFTETPSLNLWGCTLTDNAARGGASGAGGTGLGAAARPSSAGRPQTSSAVRSTTTLPKAAGRDRRGRPGRRHLHRGGRHGHPQPQFGHAQPGLRREREARGRWRRDWRWRLQPGGADHRPTLLDQEEQNDHPRR